MFGGHEEVSRRVTLQSIAPPATIDRMSDWCPDTLPEGVPLYIALADALARDLEAARLRPGERLPTHRALARRLGINVMTVTRGYAEAARRGLVEGEVGRGTFVRAQGRPANDFLPLEPDGRRLVDFHFNLPAGDPSILDVEEMLARFAAEPGSAPLFTGYAALGLEAHRAAGADWLARSGVAAAPERTLVAGGAQHAMTLAFSALTSPGDLVLCEELTYPGAKALASTLHLRLAGLPMDREGLSPEAFEAAARRGEAKLLYTMPNLHNPRGVVLSAERRSAIAEIARRHGVWIVEDDTYGFLLAQPPRPLAALAPERTFLITGTSKSLAAGLRVGYLLAPADDPGVMERLSSYVAAISWMAAPLLGELATRWIASGAADRMVAWKRYEARARRELLARAFPGARVDSHPGCSHQWLPLPDPWRAQEFAGAALRRGVVVTAAETFVVGRGAAPHAVRLCLGTPGAREEVARGVAILTDLTSARRSVQAALV